LKKAIITTVTLLSLASTAFAATPAMNVAAGQTELGYSYSNLQTKTNGFGDLGTLNANSYQLAYGLSNKLAITGDYLGSNPKDFNVYTTSGYQTISGIKFNSTAIGLQYKLNDNVAVSAGSIKSEISSSYGSIPSTEVFGGIAFTKKLSNNVTGYASYLKSTNVEDVKAGLTYNLGSATSLDVGYRNYQNSGVGNVTAKGVGFGINHKF